MSNTGVDELVGAAEDGNVGEVTRLLNSGVDINGINNNDCTALRYASVLGHEAVVRLLLSRGANVNSANMDGDTALMWACRGGHLSVVEILLRSGADHSLQDVNGDTALHDACFRGHPAVAELLLRHGASHTCRNEEGKTPIEMCKDSAKRAQIQAVIDSATPAVPSPASVAALAPAPPSPAPPVPPQSLASAPTSTASMATVEQLRGRVASLNPKRSSVQDLPTGTFAEQDLQTRETHAPNMGPPERTLPQIRTDVFLTHDWGQDGRNHTRVADINRRLTSGADALTTWFDEERMQGDVRQAMRNGIENADVVVVFLTSRYLHKVNSNDKRDNCKYEFEYAFNRKGDTKMVTVVMDPKVRNPRDWGGAVGAALEDNLYVDMCDDPISEKKIRQLKELIRAAQFN